MTQPASRTFFSQGTSAAGLGLSFLAVGTEHEGTIVRVGDEEPVYDRDKGEIIPGKFQVRIALQMDHVDPNIQDDDGIRYLFVKSGMIRAIAEALNDKNTEWPEVGGRLRVKFTEQVQVPGSKFPAKRYEAEYTPPAPGQTATGQFLNNATPNAAPFAPEKPANFPQEAWDAASHDTKLAIANMPPF